MARASLALHDPVDPQQAWMHLAHHSLGVLVCAAVIVVLLTRFDERFQSRRFRRASSLRTATLIVFSALLVVNLLAALSPFLTPLVLFVELMTLVAPTVLLFVAMHLRLRTDPGPKRRHAVLVVGAHPDDIELGCGGTVARMADHKHEVHALVMSRGQNGGDAEQRIREAKRGGEFLAVSSIEVLDFPDTKLQSAGPDMVVEIERVIRERRPDVILTHSSHDQHQDHAAVHLATLRAARRHHSILCYESPSATRSFNPSVFVDIDDYVDVKVAAVQLHEGQMSKPYMSSTRVRGVAAFRGQQARLVHAEAFEPVRLLHSGIGVLD